MLGLQQQITHELYSQVSQSPLRKQTQAMMRILSNTCHDGGCYGFPVEDSQIIQKVSLSELESLERVSWARAFLMEGIAGGKLIGGKQHVGF